MTFARMLWLFPVLLWLQAVSAQLKVGDTVCIEGFILDGFCLYDNCQGDRGCNDYTRSRLLDIGVNSLENPDRHTFHCLLDVGLCTDSIFHIIADPVESDGPYSVAFSVDDEGKNMLIAEGQRTGFSGGGCTTCTGPTDGPRAGFRAEVTGRVTSLGGCSNANPPSLQVELVRSSLGLDSVCASNYTCVAPVSPTLSPTVSSAASENDGSSNDATSTTLSPTVSSAASENDGSSNDATSTALGIISVLSFSSLALLSVFGGYIFKKENAAPSKTKEVDEKEVDNGDEEIRT